MRDHLLATAPPAWEFRRLQSVTKPTRRWCTAGLRLADGYPTVAYLSAFRMPTALRPGGKRWKQAYPSAYTISSAHTIPSSRYDTM